MVARVPRLWSQFIIDEIVSWIYVKLTKLAVLAKLCTCSLTQVTSMLQYIFKIWICIVYCVMYIVFEVISNHDSLGTSRKESEKKFVLQITMADYSLTKPICIFTISMSLSINNAKLCSECFAINRFNKWKLSLNFHRNRFLKQRKKSLNFLHMEYLKVSPFRMPQCREHKIFFPIWKTLHSHKLEDRK